VSQRSGGTLASSRPDDGVSALVVEGGAEATTDSEWLRPFFGPFYDEAGMVWKGWFESLFDRKRKPLMGLSFQIVGLVKLLGLSGTVGC
jgi:hypothetical protein